MKRKVLIIAIFFFSLEVDLSAQNTSEIHKPLRNLVNENPVKAFDEGRTLIKEGKKKRDPSREGTGNLIIGNVYWVFGEFPKALEHYFKAIKLFEKANDRYGLITVYNDLSLIYSDEKNFEDGLEYLVKAKSINREYNDKWLEAVILSNIGDIYLETEKLDSAYFYTSKSLSLAEEAGDYSIYPYIVKNLGRIMLLQGNLEDSLTFYSNAVILSESINDETHLIEILNEIGEYFWEKESYDSAKIMYYQAFVKARNFNSDKWILKTAQNIEEYFAGKSQYDSAYHYSKIASEARGIIRSSEIVQNTLRLKNQEEIREAEQEEIRKIKEEARQHLIEYLAIIFIIFLMICAIFFLRKITIPILVLEIWLVASLLLFFEFITLLVHSYAGELTGHSPFLTLLILVVMAAVLGPTHHYSHKVLKKKLIRK